VTVAVAVTMSMTLLMYSCPFAAPLSLALSASEPAPVDLNLERVAPASGVVLPDVALIEPHPIPTATLTQGK